MRGASVVPAAAGLRSKCVRAIRERTHVFCSAQALVVVMTLKPLHLRCVPVRAYGDTCDAGCVTHAHALPFLILYRAHAHTHTGNKFRTGQSSEAAHAKVHIKLFAIKTCQPIIEPPSCRRDLNDPFTIISMIIVTNSCQADRAQRRSHI